MRINGQFLKRPVHYMIHERKYDVAKCNLTKMSFSVCHPSTSNDPSHDTNRHIYL